MDITELTCYIQPMKPGPKPKPESELMKLVGVKLPPDLHKEVEVIAATFVGRDKDNMSLAGRLLLLRGLRAYKKEGKLDPDFDGIPILQRQAVHRKSKDKSAKKGVA